ncbi:MAG: NAD-dependent epimerase/dehydratase family protein [Bacteroidota bacterium]
MILITGGTGLVGSRLIYDYAQQGIKVRAIRRGNGIGNLRHYSGWENFVEWVSGDVLDISSIDEALVGVSHIIHCANIVSFNPRDYAEMMKVNTDGTANMVNAAIAHGGIVCFTHVSSVATLGRVADAGELDEHSDWIPGKHNSVYSISKFNAEREVWRAHAEGLAVNMVNPSIILGPGNWKTDSSSLFMKIKNKFPFYTDGVSGFVGVEDVSRAIIELNKSAISGERYILNSANISFQELFNLMANNLHQKAPSIKVPFYVSQIIWRFEWLKYKLTGQNPFITKETAYSAHQKRYYNGNKIVNDLNFKYNSLPEVVKSVCSYLK